MDVVSVELSRYLCYTSSIFWLI